jgi:hypothetical protein
MAGGRLGGAAGFEGLGGAAGRFDGRDFGGLGSAENRFSAPGRGQLNRFLGLPSDDGLHQLGSAGVRRGDWGVGRDLGIGEHRPNVGDRGLGFDRFSPAARYRDATAVRGNFHHWDVYGADWYRAHPGAWYAAGWAAGAAWRTATWNSIGAWMNYYPSAPVYYDYGNNVTYQDDNVYVNGQDAGTTEQYYEQGSHLAAQGAQADASPDGDWLPLGVFALTKADHTTSDVTIQLAVNRQGVIRGNYTDTKTDKTQVVQGSVDKQSQRVAFTVGDDPSHFVETGLYNLTKDEAPVVIHLGKDRTEQWLLVRLKQPTDE